MGNRVPCNVVVMFNMSRSRSTVADLVDLLKVNLRDGVTEYDVEGLIMTSYLVVTLAAVVRNRSGRAFIVHVTMYCL